MFARINLKGASHIAINIPMEGADKSLPALAAMLEKNAVFLQIGYREIQTVKPHMEIVLGDFIEHEGENGTIKIQKSNSIIDETFTIQTPDVLISNAKALAKKDAELKRKTSEITLLKSQLEILKGRLQELQGSEE